MVIAHILKIIVAEAEVSAIYNTAQEIVPLHMAAINMGHLQHPHISLLTTALL